MARTSTSDGRARFTLRVAPALYERIKDRSASQGISATSFCELALFHAVDDGYLHTLTIAARNSLLSATLIQLILPRLVDGDVQSAIGQARKLVNQLLGDPPPMPESVPRGGSEAGGDFVEEIMRVCHIYATEHFNITKRVQNTPNT